MKLHNASLLFSKQQSFGAVPWSDFAQQAEIPDMERFDACIKDPGRLERIDQGMRLADAFGVRGTPTIIVNGWRLVAPPSSADFERFVKNVAAGRPPAEI